MFKAMWNNWKSAGYWSEVVMEYSKLTGLNLEKMAKATNDEHLLDHFCQKANEMGYSAKGCAKVIFDRGFHDIDELALNYEWEMAGQRHP
jgi:regulator of sigma D